MPFDAGRIPGALRSAYLDGRCAVLVGAGASAGAGLPLWGGLLERMLAAGEAEHRIAPARVAQYRTLLQKPDKFLMVASGIKSDVGNLFDEIIEDIFVKSEPQPTDLHRALVELDRLRFILTTNYDTLIEDAFRATGKRVSVNTSVDAGDVHRRLLKREFFLLKAHGDAARIGNGIILTDADYRELQYRQMGYRSLLSAMFTMFSIVFVGASMADPEINLLLSFIADSFPTTSGPVHYALLAEEDITEVERERWLKDFKVQIIPISRDNNYSELTDFIQTLVSVGRG